MGNPERLFFVRMLQELFLRGLRMDRILVCGTQADTCVRGAGFALFDAGYIRRF